MIFNEMKKQEFENLKQAVLVLQEKVWKLENPFLFNVGDKVKTVEGVGIVVDRCVKDYWSGIGKEYKVHFIDKKYTAEFAESELGSED